MYEKEIAIFRLNGGVLRTMDAIEKGIHPRILYAMRDKKIIEKLCRGVYRLADMQPMGYPDLITVAVSIPNAVVCLISALAFHEITTQVPREVHVAILRDSRYPKLEYPPICVYRFSSNAYAEGIEIYKLDGINVKIYSPEKTLVDCFKYRNKIGIDTTIEAIRLYVERKQIKPDEIISLAKTCRVEKVIRPYLESIL